MKLASILRTICMLLPGITSGLAEGDWYFDNWCGNSDLVYLVDGNCQKQFPSNFSRDWSCPIAKQGS